MKSSKILAVIIAVGALLWIGSGMFASDENAASETTPQGQIEEKPPKELQSVRIRVQQAQPYQDRIEITGRTKASRTVEMKAEIIGEIAAILKEEGERVEQGEALAELDVRDRKIRQAEMRQRVEQRQIEYNAAKELAERGFNSKVKLAQTAADLESARAALKQAAIDVDKTSINAPFEGILARQSIDVGDYVNTGDSLFTIVDLDPIEVVAYVSERNVQDLQPGQSAQAVFLGGETLEGTISYIAPAADDQTRTFRIIMSAANPDARIKDGLTARIIIPTKDKQAHKITPSILTLNDAGQIGVKLVDDENRVRFVPVRILDDMPDFMWVSGPPDNVRIITVGAEYVIEGQEVNPVESEGDGLL